MNPRVLAERLRVHEIAQGRSYQEMHQLSDEQVFRRFTRCPRCAQQGRAVDHVDAAALEALVAASRNGKLFRTLAAEAAQQGCPGA
jgi:hypothetical protein